MLMKLLSRLSARPDAARLAPRVDLATAALFVHVARSDNDYAEDERAAIDRVLADAFSLAPDAAAALRREAETVEKNAADVVRFTQALKLGLTEPERAAFLEQIWRVVLSDGVRHPQEDAFMRKLAGLLHIPDPVSHSARRRAAEG
jgi:uncharacterized tellurite resistance protein B-like protein